MHARNLPGADTAGKVRSRGAKLSLARLSCLGWACHHDPWWDLEADEAETVEAPENVTMGMLYQEVRGLKRIIAEVFKRYATE